MRKKTYFLLLILITAVLFVGCTPQKTKENTNESAAYFDFEPISEIKEGRKNIYVVLKVITSQYWQDIIDGITDAGKECDCNIYMGGSEIEGDWETQITLLNKAVDECGADAIVLAPSSSSYLGPTIADIKAKDLPVVLVDTIVNTNDFDICYMTDNLSAGEAAAKEMLSKLKEKGISETEKASIAIQIPSTSSQTIIDRLAGFNQYWAATAPADWYVLDEVKLNGGNKDTAKENCADYLASYSDLKGLFGCNNSSTVGFVNGLTESGRDDVVMVGFDYADETAALVASDKYTASTVVQNQYNMGYEGLKTAVAMLNGETVKYKFVDTGARVINSDNQSKYEAEK